MNRRGFIHSASGLLLAMANLVAPGATGQAATRPKNPHVTLFLGGDLMTGRGIDQILPHPSEPTLFEPYIEDARGYVRLAEQAHGDIQRPVGWDYIWGDALQVLEQVQPDLRVINLETAVTSHPDHWRGKGIHYRMHPDNVPCLTAAGIEVCTLANNHTMDWQRAGLLETLDTLQAAGIQTAGAGRDLAAAAAPASIEIGTACRLRIYSMATLDSGVFDDMRATVDRPGMHALASLKPQHTATVLERMRSQKRPGDLVVASIHWGGNWGYRIPPEQRAFARELVNAGADVVHGHSSHHAKGIEVIDDRPVLYGCGDLLNDYEGIRNAHDRYHGDRVLMYFVTLDAGTGALQSLKLRPMRVRNFRLQYASPEETEWLQKTLHREGRALNTAVESDIDGFLSVSRVH